MKKLNKDDLFEIEKVMDIYAGWIVEGLNKSCQTSIHYDAMKKVKCPLDDSIKSLEKTYNKVKEIRKKLEENRKGN